MDDRERSYLSVLAKSLIAAPPQEFREITNLTAGPRTPQFKKAVGAFNKVATSITSTPNRNRMRKIQQEADALIASSSSTERMVGESIQWAIANWRQKEG